MYLFSYGANMSKNHLNKIINYKFLDTGILKNFKLKFNHFGLYGNIEESLGSNIYGTIINIDKNNLNKLKKIEFMYKIIKVKVNDSKNNIIECLAFKSKVPLMEIGVLPKYQKKVIEGYEENNLPLPKIKKFNYELFKVIINTLGFCFGIYLHFYTKFKLIGVLLFIVDFSMVIDQIFNDTRFYNNFSDKYPKLFFFLYKIIPTFVFAPYIIYNGNELLKYGGIIFFIVDIITLIKYYIENLITNKN